MFPFCVVSEFLGKESPLPSSCVSESASGSFPPTLCQKVRLFMAVQEAWALPPVVRLVADHTKPSSPHSEKVTGCLTATNVHISQRACLVVLKRLNHSLFLYRSALKFVFGQMI